MREALLRAAAQWCVCRSARAAMWAPYESGVPFRTLTNDDGVLECWQQPKLPAWEVPKRNPHERRPRAREWKPNKVVAEIAELTADRDDAAGGNIAAWRALRSARWRRLRKPQLRRHPRIRAL